MQIVQLRCNRIWGWRRRHESAMRRRGPGLQPSLHAGLSVRGADVAQDGRDSLLAGGPVAQDDVIEGDVAADRGQALLGARHRHGWRVMNPTTNRANFY